MVSRRNIRKPIPYSRHHLDEDDISAVIEILKGASITQGQMVEDFGQAVADYSGAKYGVAVASGTAALHLSVTSLGLGQGDEVITTPMSFCATSNAVLYQGADVRFVDIDPNTMNIDVTQIEENITRRTKAIMPVDFRGHPADWPSIKKLADKYNLKTIQDGSHSLGSDYFSEGKQYRCGDGSHATLCTHSFHPAKHITTGEGGVISTNDEQLAKKLFLLRKHGVDRTEDMFSKTDRIGSWFYDMKELGFNYRITDFQSALGLAQLKKAETFKHRRRQIVNYYNEQFEDLEELTIPYESDDVESNFHLYILQVNENDRFDRYDLYNYLRESGYLVMVHYIPIHFLSYYRDRYGLDRGSFPVCEQLYERAISLPLYPSLSDSEVEEVVSVIKEYVKVK